MELMTFEGGVHPPETKLTAAAVIVDLPRPKRVVLPLSQHIGAPAQAKVKIGQEVTCGEVIAEPGGFVSAAVHATIGGKITAIGNFLHPLGTPMPAIVIEGTDASEPAWTTVEDGLNLPPDEIRNRVAAAGIVGLGGATFPTRVKLAPPPAKPIDTVILNGVECEPCLTSDHRLMLEKPDDIITGLRLLMRVLGAKQGWIGIEANKPDAIALMCEKLRGDQQLRVAPLKVQYPQGGEKQLIVAVTGREVPSGGLPMDVGVVVQNVATAAAITDAVNRQRPLLERVVTLTGNCAAKPGNYRVRIGTLVSEFIEMAGGLKADVPLRKVILGGPMMGSALFDLKVPVIKGTSGVLCWDASEAVDPTPTVCIRCGRCIEACPMRLMPQQLKSLIECEQYEGSDRAGVLDCIECGSCAFICPARLPLVHAFKLAKRQVQALRKRAADKARAEAAKKEQGKAG